MSDNETRSCPKCGALIKDGDVFCRKCGAKHLSGVYEVKPFTEVERTCRNCGNPLRSAARYCDLCGEEAVRVRREKRRKNRKTGCLVFLILILLLWAAAAGSAIALYNTFKGMSAKEVLTFVKDKFFSPDAGQKTGNTIGNSGAGQVSSDVVPPDTRTYEVEPLAPGYEDELPAPLDDAESFGKNAVRETPRRPTAQENEREIPKPGTSEEDSAAPDRDEVILAAPLSISPETGEAIVSADAALAKNDTGTVAENPADNAEARDNENGNRNADLVWTEPDSGGYSTVAASDRFFTSSQTPSLRGTITGDNVRVRSAPNTNSRVKRQLDSGTEVELVRRFSSGKDRYYWFEVHDANGSGWLYGEFLKPESGENRTSAQPAADTEP